MKKLGFLVAVASLLCVTPALAQQEGAIQAAVDLHPVISLSDGAGDGVGFGFDVRGGYALQLEGLTLVPEGVLGYTWFGTGVDEISMGLFRFMAGARAVFEAGGVIPSVYGHLGFGSLSTTVEIPTFGFFGGGSTSFSDSTTTAVIDLGGALDFPVAENFLVGGHAGFNIVTAEGTLTFLNFGAQASYRF